MGPIGFEGAKGSQGLQGIKGDDGAKGEAVSILQNYTQKVVKMIKIL